MKCRNCGAEIGSSKYCEYCGSQVTARMKKEQDYLNKEGCPRCGSLNTSFEREERGAVASGGSYSIIHETVGICKDCGYTWSTSRSGGYADMPAYVNINSAPVKKRKTWLWVLGWIFVFPLPLTLILLKKKDLKPVIKYGIIAAAWIVYFIIASAGN